MQSKALTWHEACMLNTSLCPALQQKPSHIFHEVTRAIRIMLKVVAPCKHMLGSVTSSYYIIV